MSQVFQTFSNVVIANWAWHLSFASFPLYRPKSFCLVLSNMCGGYGFVKPPDTTLCAWQCLLQGNLNLNTLHEQLRNLNPNITEGSNSPCHISVCVFMPVTVQIIVFCVLTLVLSASTKEHVGSIYGRSERTLPCFRHWQFKLSSSVFWHSCCRHLEKNMLVPSLGGQNKRSHVSFSPFLLPHISLYLVPPSHAFEWPHLSLRVRINSLHPTPLTSTTKMVAACSSQCDMMLSSTAIYMGNCVSHGVLGVGCWGANCGNRGYGVHAFEARCMLPNVIRCGYVMCVM